MSVKTQLASQQRMERMQKIALLLNPPRLSLAEQDQLQTVFGDDAVIYKLLRDLLYGFELTKEEQDLAKVFQPVTALLRKIFIPEVTKNIAFGQNYDLWQTQDMKTATEESFPTSYKSKCILLEMLETALARLSDPSRPGVSLAIEDSLASVLARNSFISYVDNQIRFIIQYVNMDGMSDDDIKKMIQLNSAK